MLKKTLMGLMIFLSTLSGPTNAQEVVGPVDEVAVIEKQKEERRDTNKKIALPGYVATQAVHVLDIVTTTQCGKPNNGCVEKWNEGLYGREPKLGRVLLVKVPMMALTHLIYDKVSPRNPAAAYTFFAISGVVTGKAVVGNIRVLW